ncbi:pentatricopeptide repeat-containing protein At5g64320, mitochondrial-like [Mangifera indica]|uniref:pentatricopeptide repeat-containing protein At5g64320, mitochondrial-like n=1 Tax=Mangifera indica TaxID=29780 RepID=UPI001CF945FB|nr:pentatricopeptide repeat-containing protein At5g64320, mitochondrial-like [Mangifera indica]XP_044483009.1 pentatricopeptide repeat-containing protein At5g64320, mitochondrial-like [Mangifera indica]XP_044483010.1 pentatricopeptide repeat-containing protein At5g64320, mitochondrial-like [Mangifera indica]XP_044483011.1 pentatricopeptide repeat-containing protein At5g64320, mitochondrial-like [Mangifera indica]XP_044483012.1 pentatricopeptide repeat-containing protein At5g64320, mitochondrial
MAIKLSSLTCSSKILKCVLTARISSLSYASTLQVTDYEVKIQSLRNKLFPDNLIRVLDSTGDLNSAVKIFKWASLQKGFQHTADTYGKIILNLGLAGNVEQMEGFCQNMMKDKCPNAKETLISLVELFVQHNRVNEAIRVLVSMILGGFMPSVDVFNVLLGAIVKKKRGFEDMVFIYKEMVKAGVLPNVDTLNYLLEVLLETGRIESALDQFRRMNKKGCSPNSRSFEIIIKGLILSNRVDDSVIILGGMFNAGFEPKLSFYTCIIPLFCRENKLEEGIRLLRLMTASNLLLDELIYTELIRCMCENHRIDDANNLLEEMIESGRTPAVDVLVDLVVGLCAVGKFDEAMNFLEDKCGYMTSPYNAMLEGCCNAGKCFLAKSILDKMAERNITDCDSWNILIRWLCENMEIRKANELLSRMIKFSKVPDSVTYSALVVGNCQLRKYEDALQVFHRGCIKNWVLDSISYLELLEGLCQAGKIMEAAEVFDYMSKNKCSLNPSSYSMLIGSMCRRGQVDKAIRLRGLAYSSNTSYTTLTYTTIMHGLSKLKMAKGIMVILSQMLVDGCALDVEVYCILIQSMSAQNRSKDSAFFFNLMVNEGLVPDRETMHTLLCCLTSQSDLHMVLSGIDKLVSDSDIFDSSMYNILINSLWKEGLKSEASRLLDLMIEKGWVPDATTHRLLVGSFIKSDTDGETFAYEDSIQDSVSNILAEGLGNT